MESIKIDSFISFMRLKDHSDKIEIFYLLPHPPNFYTWGPAFEASKHLIGRKNDALRYIFQSSEILIRRLGFKPKSPSKNALNKKKPPTTLRDRRLFVVYDFVLSYLTSLSPLAVSGAREYW
jgi:hypothetical protein